MGRVLLAVIVAVMIVAVSGCATGAGSSTDAGSAGLEPKSARAPAVAARAPSGLDLDWMAGHWWAVSGERVLEEYWTSPAGGTMLGLNRSLADGRMVAFEFLRIERRAGETEYLASPGGRSPPTAFVLTERGERRAVFANPAHDFPQRIIYWREGELLRVRIEGDVDGEVKSSAWTLRPLGRTRDE